MPMSKPRRARTLSTNQRVTRRVTQTNAEISVITTMSLRGVNWLPAMPAFRNAPASFNSSAKGFIRLPSRAQGDAFPSMHAAGRDRVKTDAELLDRFDPALSAVRGFPGLAQIHGVGHARHPLCMQNSLARVTPHLETLPRVEEVTRQR